MKAKHWVLLTVGVLLALSLIWAIINLTLENDGLKQVVAGHNRSVQALLKYVQVATKCDVTPEELARALDSAVLPMRDGRTLQVAQLAFSAEFQAGEIRAIEITDVGKVTLCRGAK
ncbi:MAG: hypothetical protein U1E71_15300 [Ramlibacter sp.]|jgi:hypothetical protein